MNPNILSLLGLAKRGGLLVAGDEPVEAVVRAKDARVLLIAGDAAENTVRRARHFAELGACLWLTLPFAKSELGRAVGRTSCAMVALTDIGFAASIVRRMAEEDGAYAAAAEKLDVKAKRAAERKAERTAHEKNLRQGKVPHREPAPPPDRERRAAPPARPGPRGPDGPPRTKDASSPGGRKAPGPKRSPRPLRSERRQAAPPTPYAHSHPVKKGKGSFRKKDGA